MTVAVDEQETQNRSQLPHRARNATTSNANSGRLALSGLLPACTTAATAVCRPHVHYTTTHAGIGTGSLSVVDLSLPLVLTSLRKMHAS